MYEGARRDTQSAQSLVLNLSALETYDDDLLATSSAISPESRPRESGYYTRAAGDLFYARRTRHSLFYAEGGATFDFYPNLQAGISQPLDGYNAVAGLDVTGRRLEVQLAQTVQYQPYFSFDVIGPVITPDAPLFANNGLAFQSDVALLDEPLITYGSSARVNVPLDRRSSVDASYSYQGAQFTELWPTLSGPTASVGFHRSVGRRVRLNAAYTYQQLSNDTALYMREVTSHDVGGSVSYSRALSRTRLIEVTAGAGSTQYTDVSFIDPEPFDTRDFSARAAALLQFARSWTAQAEFRRALHLIQGLPRAYFGNAVDFGVHGELSRRVDVFANGSYLQGVPGRDLLLSDYDTFGTSVRMRVAITRNLAISAEYAHSNYSFGPGVVLPAGVLRSQDRNIARLGATFGASLLRPRPVR